MDQMNQPIKAFVAYSVIAIVVIVVLHRSDYGNLQAFDSNSIIPEKRPNIIVMFADNLGYNDISAFGAATARTPSIDRLGIEGIKLNNWNSAASLCSASRAALMTGKYPVRTGIYPGVLKPDAKYGLMPNETTVASYLRNAGYATAIVGKWHLGHRSPYLPTHHGFDEWLGIPYHMSGGSLDDHICGYDVNRTMWLPLYQDDQIVEQPVELKDLAQRYAAASERFIRKSVSKGRPFFLYLPFSHVHQMCAPAYGSEQKLCQWASELFVKEKEKATFVDAVEEMDWIAGQVLSVLDEIGIENNTLVLFTSDNGPWIAEQECSGSKGPFEGRWLRENVDNACTACPHDYKSSPTESNRRRCYNSQTKLEVNGVPCGEDTGLGGVWEANIRMPALARWPGKIPARTETLKTISTLDVLPTLLSIVNETHNMGNVDGEDVSEILFQTTHSSRSCSSRMDCVDDRRVLYFWRDGFQDGPLPSPFGRFDVASAKIGRHKFWFWTKSAHYNPDIEVHHDPPLIFDVFADPAEAFPLDPNDFLEEIEIITTLVKEHKHNITYGQPYTIFRNSEYIPCSNITNDCRISRPR